MSITIITIFLIFQSYYHVQWEIENKNKDNTKDFECLRNSNSILSKWKLNRHEYLKLPIINLLLYIKISLIQLWLLVYLSIKSPDVSWHSM